MKMCRLGQLPTMKYNISSNSMKADEVKIQWTVTFVTYWMTERSLCWHHRPLCGCCVSWYSVKQEGGVLQHRSKFRLIRKLDDNVFFLEAFVRYLINCLFLQIYAGYSMLNKTTRGFILILVAAFLSVVEGDDLQEINCKGKTNGSFHYHKLMCWNLNKGSGHPLLRYIDLLFILNKSLDEFFNVKLNELNFKVRHPRCVSQITKLYRRRLKSKHNYIMYSRRW